MLFVAKAKHNGPNHSSNLSNVSGWPSDSRELETCGVAKEWNSAGRAFLLNISGPIVGHRSGGKQSGILSHPMGFAIEMVPLMAGSAAPDLQVFLSMVLIPKVWVGALFSFFCFLFFGTPINPQFNPELKLSRSGHVQLARQPFRLPPQPHNFFQGPTQMLQEAAMPTDPSSSISDSACSASQIPVPGLRDPPVRRSFWLSLQIYPKKGPVVDLDAFNPRFGLSFP